MNGFQVICALEKVLTSVRLFTHLFEINKAETIRAVQGEEEEVNSWVRGGSACCGDTLKVRAGLMQRLH